MNLEVLKNDIFKVLLYLPDLSRIDPLSAKLSQFFPEKAKFDRQERLRRLNRPDPTPDESTSFTYSSDNNLTHADLPDGSDLDFAYDAAGRRLEKKYSKTVNNVAYETKYTYHYIGSQITTIDIQGKEDETVVKNDQMRIHLGANSRPISFEYYTDIGTEQEASETYYYHYDLHGNVIRVTDDAGATEITYAYDALGTIVSETNTNSIYNPFTWSGEAQIINDPEFDTSAASPKTGLYSSGSGYYNPETGTFLSGTGAPASVNPTSGTMEEPTAQSTRPASQLGGHAAIAAAVGGIPSSDTPASSYDAPPAVSVDVDPSAVASTSDIITVVTCGGDGGTFNPPIYDRPDIDTDTFGNGTTNSQRQENWKKIQPSKEKAEDKKGFGQISKEILKVIVAGDGLIGGISIWPSDGSDTEKFLPSPEYRDINYGMFDVVSPGDYYKYFMSCVRHGTKPVPEAIYNKIYRNLRKHGIFVRVEDLAFEIEFAIWGVCEGKEWLFAYKLRDSINKNGTEVTYSPHFFWGPHASTEKQHVEDGVCPGAEVDFTRPVKSCSGNSCSLDYPLADSFMISWGSEPHSGLAHTPFFYINNSPGSIELQVKMNHSDGSESTKGWFAIINFYIPDGVGGSIEDRTLTYMTFGNEPVLPEYMNIKDPFGSCYYKSRKGRRTYFMP